MPNVTRETGLLNLIGRLLPRRLDRGRVGAGELDTDKHQEDRGSPEESEVPVGRRAANGRSLSEKDNGRKRRQPGPQRGPRAIRKNVGTRKTIF